MPKKHLTSEFGGAACRRGPYHTDNVHEVTCEVCKKTPEFVERFEAAALEKQKAFEAQVPHEVKNPWTSTNLVCHECGCTTFRDKDRDLWTYWYVCSGCGKMQGYPTETGMCQ
jgi:hypothetical protein